MSTVVEIIDAVRRLDENKKTSFLPNSPRSISTTRGIVKSTLTREQDGLIFFGRKRSGTSRKDGPDRSMKPVNASHDKDGGRKSAGRRTSTVAVCLDEICSWYSRLRTDRAQGRCLQSGMIWQGQRSPRAIRVRSHHRNVLPFPHDLESERTECLQNFRLGGVDRKLHPVASEASAMNASMTSSSSSKASFPKLSM